MRGVVAENLPRGALASLTCGSHSQKNLCREAPARPIGVLREGADTGLPRFY
jgi:hypothetical protein